MRAKLVDHEYQFKKLKSRRQISNMLSFLTLIELALNRYNRDTYRIGYTKFRVQSSMTELSEKYLGICQCTVCISSTCPIKEL